MIGAKVLIIPGNAKKPSQRCGRRRSRYYPLGREPHRRR
jgi:hypothetical protein